MNIDKIIRFFECGLTGDEMAIVLIDGKEVCIPAEMTPYQEMTPHF